MIKPLRRGRRSKIYKQIFTDKSISGKILQAGDERSGIMHNLKYEDRCKIEALYKARHTQREIAHIMGVHYNTINREIKRGRYKRLDSEYRFYESYSADIAQQDYDYKQTSKGAPLKIGKDYALVAYIEDKIIDEGLSPDAVLGRIKQQKLCFETSICKATLYSYIDKGVFLRLSNKHIKKRRCSNHAYKRVRIYRPLCRTIDERPAEVSERRTFGHWEIDTVRGKQGTKACLLVLTERKSRYEIIRKLPNGTHKAVENALTKLKYQYGTKHFQTITCDNGSEFDGESIEKIMRCPVYYCNPYSSWERGSNENANRIIRRFIPKGKDMTNITSKRISDIEQWINSMPRKVLSYWTSYEVFENEKFLFNNITNTY